MRTTVVLESNLLDELVAATHAISRTAAVREAIEERLQKARVATIRAAAGKLQFDLDAETLRHGDDRLG